MDKQGKSDTVLQVNLHTLATLVGVIFLLLGVYTAIRVAANLKMYEKSYQQFEIVLKMNPNDKEAQEELRFTNKLLNKIDNKL